MLVMVQTSHIYEKTLLTYFTFTPCSVRTTTKPRKIIMIDQYLK